MEESLLSKKKLNFPQGSNYFRQRLVLSLLSARPVHISEIRSQSPYQVGVTDYEVSFVRLLDKLSNGSKFKISETGTEVSLIPGTLAGGTITHVCHQSRPLSYYLEPVLLLAPFCKKPLRLGLQGRIQNDGEGYNSIYKLKHAAFPIIEIFGIEPDLQVKFRSFEESEILFTSTVKKQLLSLRNQLNQEAGKVKKVRGLAYGFRISPQMLNRVITSAKGVFLPFINDVFITSDPVKNSKSKSPGYGLVLYAETTRNITYAVDGFIGREELEKANESKLNPMFSTDLSSLEPGAGGHKRSFNLFPEEEESSGTAPKKMAKLMMSVGESDKKEGKSGPSSVLTTTITKSYSKSPEELGIAISKQLLAEISTESRVDSVFQWLVLGFMTLGPKDVTSVVMGPLTPFTIQFLRDIKTFFGVTFKVEDYFDTVKNEVDEDDEDDEDKTKRISLYKLSCLGTGYINLNKTMV